MGVHALFKFVILASVLATSGPVQVTKVAQADLTRASIAISDVEHCAAKRASWELKYEALSARQFAEQERVEGLLGAGVEPDILTLVAAEPELAPHCSDSFVEAASLRAEAAFLRAEGLADRLEAKMTKGLWLGLFPLCASTVQSAKLISSPDTGGPAVLFEFKLENADELTAYSKSFVSDKNITISMHVRLDGRVIASPRVYEPITNALMLTGPSAPEAEAVVAAATQICPAR
jgi:hypothetical protein